MDAQALLPRSPYLYLCRTITRSIGSAFVRMFAPDGAVQAYNLYSIRKLSEDIAELQVGVCC